MILVYCPCKDKREAKSIAKELIAKRLVACANIFRSDSLYVWKNKLHDDKEAVMLLKAKDSDKEKIIKEIRRLHSYDLPAIITFKAGANKEFEDWIKNG